MKTFLESVKEIVEKYDDDPDVMHHELDCLMEDLLIVHGHVEAINLIREQTRWYS